MPSLRDAYKALKLFPAPEQPKGEAMSAPMLIPNNQVREQMSVAMNIPRVVVGDTLTLEIKAQDPSGIKEISVDCYAFSLWNSTRTKTATGSFRAERLEPGRAEPYRIEIRVPEDAAIGQWGVRSIRFVNGRNAAQTFYRGQGRFDAVVFEVLPLPAELEESLRFEGVDIVHEGE